jgi:hypothetical protein
MEIGLRWDFMWLFFGEGGIEKIVTVKCEKFLCAFERIFR